MDFLRDLGLMAAGYAISGLSESNAVADLVDSKFGNKSLEEVIDKWAHDHNIYMRNDDLYCELLRIAEKYRDPYVR
ncbi:MAG: hypothetical protein J5542_02335 [Bacteroidales bacterium]|nr:hypothetical protein [Bacteroidales bacterium]